MKKLIALTAAAVLAAGALQAGGPVIVEDTTVTEKPASSAGWVVPVLILGVIGLAIASSNDDSQGATW